MASPTGRWVMVGGGGLGWAWVDPGPPPPTPLPATTPVTPVVTLVTGTSSTFRDTAATKGALGQFLPIVYGSDRLTGAVIWADTVKTTVLPQVSSADALKDIHTVSFALALCEGTIRGILRMWIGDRLIFDQSMSVDASNIAQVNASGVIGSTTTDLTDPDSPFKTVPDAFKQTKITLFNGGEEQLPRGAIVTVEGFEGTPAYRGVAYILFENFLINGADLPEIQVELCANTELSFPHLSAARDAGTSIFSSWGAGFTSYDVVKDLIYVHGVGSGDVIGRAVLDGNTLELISEEDYGTTNILETTTAGYRGVIALPVSGNWLTTDNGSTNTVPLYTLEPRSGAIIDTFGTASISLANSDTSVNGVGVMSTMSCPADGGIFLDTVLTIGAAVRNTAFFQVDQYGAFVGGKPMHYQNGLGLGPARSCGLAIDAAFYAGQPTFADGVSSLGYHFFILTNDSGPNIGVWRATVGTKNGGPTFSTADFTEVSVIDCTSIFGSSADYSIYEINVDPIDKCLIVLVSVIGGTDVVIKYDPYADAVQWIARLPGDLPGGNRTQNPSAVLSNQRWTFIVGTRTLVTVDLTNGEVTTVADDIRDYALPAMGDQSCFFNGYEDSVLYMAGGVAVKLFINRVVRTSVELSDVVSDLMRRCGLDDHDIVLDDLASLTVDGYTIFTKKTLKEAFAELAQVFYFDVVESNGRILFRTRGGAIDKTIPHSWLGFVNPEGWLPETHVNDFTRVRRVNLTYRDQDREYQTNTQSISLPDINDLDVEQDSTIDVTVPVVMTAQKAKALAEILLYAKLVYQSTYEMKLSTRYLDLDPADIITLQMNDAGTDTKLVRLRSISFADGMLSVNGTLEDASIYADTVMLFGNIGRFTASTFPTSSIRIEPLYLDIPWLTLDELAHVSSTHNFCLTWLPRSTGANLTRSSSVQFSTGESFRIIPPGAHMPTWGNIVTPPNAVGSFYSVDTANVVRVRIHNVDTSIALANATSSDALILDDTLNLAYFGGELIQFTTVVDEGGGVFAFSGLLRAKFGTDPFVNAHVAGEPFVVLSDNTGAVSLAYARAQIPLQSSFPIPLRLSTNIGDPRVLDPAIQWDPRNHQPWTVAALTAAYVSTDAVLTWARRERYGGEWDDDGDDSVPLHEDLEQYTLYLTLDTTAFKVSDPTTYLRKVVVTTPTFTYDAAMQTADGFDRTVDTLYVGIAQSGNSIGPIGRFSEAVLPHL